MPAAHLPAQPGPAGSDTIHYDDRLITITVTSLTFRNYSLLQKPRQVKIADIDHIDVLEPSLTTGKNRMWGSGNFTMWYPMDGSRSSRDTLFHVYLKAHGMNVGLTVEHSPVVTAILRSQGLVRPLS